MRILFAVMVWMFSVTIALAESQAQKDCDPYRPPSKTAISSCTQIIQSGKMHGNELSKAYAGRARAYHDRRDFARAIPDYDHAIELDANNSFLLTMRALCRRATGDYQRAIDDYNQVIQHSPDDESTYQYRGELFLEMKDYDRAIADFKKGAELKPAHTYNLSNLARAYSGKGDFSNALSVMNEKISRSSPAAWADLDFRGFIKRSIGDYAGAMVDYDEAAKLQPKVSKEHLLKALAAFESGDRAFAVMEISTAVNINPNDASSKIWSYILSARSGKADTSALEAAADQKVEPATLAIYNMFLGRMEPNRAIEQFWTAPSTLYRDIGMCEARGFAGEWYLLHQDKMQAAKHFQWVVGNCGSLFDVTVFPAAIAELRALPKEVAPLIEAVAPQGPKPPTTNSALASATPVLDHRIALVIGNSAYENVGGLPNPERDAALVADTFKRTGFESVTLQTNLRKDALIAALRIFAKQAESADWAVIYYAGHGMEVGGTNYLIPIDAKLKSDRDIGFEAVPLEQVLNAAERAQKLRLVILDACRDNPFASQMKRSMMVATRSVSRGLAAVEPDAGLLVVYAAKDGETAEDGAGNNSPFAVAFTKDVQTPGLEVRRLFDFVRDDVMESTGRKQKPFSYGSISGRQDFYFVSAK